MRSLPFVLALFALSCGGIAVFEDGAGGAGNAGSGTAVGPSASSGGSKTTGATSATKAASVSATSGVSACEQLEVPRAQAFEDATRCDACIDFDPCGLAFVTDRCGCIVPATGTQVAMASEQAYAAWVAAGCGPLDCNAPCPQPGAAFCEPQGQGCAGTCSF